MEPTISKLLTLLLLTLTATGLRAQSGLNRSSFNKFWCVEAEADSRVSFSGDIGGPLSLMANTSEARRVNP